MYGISGEIGRSGMDLKMNHLLFIEYGVRQKLTFKDFGGHKSCPHDLGDFGGTTLVHFYVFSSYSLDSPISYHLKTI